MTDGCYKINSAKGVDFVGRMSTMRAYATSVTINDTLLWITGGKSTTLQQIEQQSMGISWSCKFSLIKIQIMSEFKVNAQKTRFNAPFKRF